MKHKNILITGGAGFVGSNLAISFKKRYPHTMVLALDNLKRRGGELNILRLKENGVGFIHGDIRNPEDLNLGQKIDLLIECSAEPSVLAGYLKDPLYIINTNLSGTINCLELARKNRADVIFLSTSRIYPYTAINNIRIREHKARFAWQANQKIAGWSKAGIAEDFTKEGPKSLYGATKLASELILQEYIASGMIKGVVNRCGVIAGPWQFGKVDQGIFTFWMLAHYFKKNIKYIGFGAKGKQVRDLLHVDDLFELIDAELHLLNKINGNTYNAGGGEKISLSLYETTDLCRQITGNRIAIGKEKATRPADLAIYITDNKKVSRDTGWSPKIKAGQILEDIYQWIDDNEDRLNILE